MARWRIAVGAGIVVALAVVAAFVVSSVVREEPEVVAEPVAAPASPSPTATADPDPMPELHNTGEDFDQIIRSIEEFRSWLYRNPQPRLAREIYANECTCLADLQQRLERLSRSGARFASNTTIVHEVGILDRAPPYVALRVVDEGRVRVVVDGTGQELDRSQGWSRRAYRFLLVDVDGSWLVSDIIEMETESASRSPGA